MEDKALWKKDAKAMSKYVTRRFNEQDNTECKIFVDSECRFPDHKSMYKLIEAADFSLWHIPFNQVAVVGPDVIIRLISAVLEETNERLPRTGTMYAHKRSGESFEATYHIGKGVPIGIPISKSDKLVQLRLLNGYSLYLVIKRATDKNGRLPTPLLADADLKEFFIAASSYGIMYFADFCVDPKYFVVEIIDAANRPRKGKKQKPKKSVYSIIHIKKIRKQYITHEDSDGRLKIGHERRRHPRTYRHRRYVNMRGKTVIINSTWVGPKTARKGNKIYKVHTDIM